MSYQLFISLLALLVLGHYAFAYHSLRDAHVSTLEGPYCVLCVLFSDAALDKWSSLLFDAPCFDLSGYNLFFFWSLNFYLQEYP